LEISMRVGPRPEIDPLSAYHADRSAFSGRRAILVQQAPHSRPAITDIAMGPLSRY
jgi:hypothetical protein